MPPGLGCVLHLLAVIYNLQVEWQCLERFIYKLICWHIPLEDYSMEKTRKPRGASRKVQNSQECSDWSF